MSGSRAKRNRNRGVTIVVRRGEEGAEGHHGGAWKVAYADFVTAMMAFFLLMWLLNATTEEQRRGLADYFSPPNFLGRTVSGSGQPFGGQTPNDQGNLTSTTGAIRIETGPEPIVLDIEQDESDVPARPMIRREGPEGPEDEEEARSVARVPRVMPEAPDAPPAEPTPTAAAAAPGPPSPEVLTEEALRAELAQRERAAFEQAAEQLRNAVQADPALADLARQLRIEQVPEGMRIQILDAERQPMFALGGSAPNERARALLLRVVQAVASLPNPIAIAGHTDATPFRGGGDRSNWDLSAERANATRRLMAEAGIAEARIRSVTGHAERDPLLPEDPSAAANRRVSITLLRMAAPAPAANAEAPAEMSVR